MNNTAVITTVARNIMTEAEFIKQIERANVSNTRNAEDNFQNIELSNVRIENKSLARSAEFSFSKLSNVTFVNVDLAGTEWNYTELENVTFIRCKLNRIEMDYAAMNNVRFDNCFMDSCSFDFASGSAQFNNCHLHGAEFHHTLANLTFNSCSGEALELNYCPDLTINAENCDFHRAEFVDGRLKGTLKNCVLTDSDWYATDATELSFVSCGMRELNISGSTGVAIAAGDDDDDDDFDLDFE